MKGKAEGKKEGVPSFVLISFLRLGEGGNVKAFISNSDIPSLPLPQLTQECGPISKHARCGPLLRLTEYFACIESSISVPPSALLPCAILTGSIFPPIRAAINYSERSEG